MKNKDKPGNHSHKQRKPFSSFFLSIYDMVINEALVIITNLSRLVLENRKEPLLHVHGWVNGWIIIAVARSYSFMIHGDNLPINRAQLGTGQGPMIGPRLSAIEYVPESFCIYIRTLFCHLHNPNQPPSQFYAGLYPILTLRI